MGVKEKYKNFPTLSKDIKEKINNLKEVFIKNKVKIAYLFGSILKEENPEDIDIAVILEGDYFRLLEDIKEFLNTQRIDLIDLSQVSPFIALHIIKNGEIIFKENTKIENEYEMNILKKCQDLEAFRRKQLEFIKKAYDI
uniref:Nucleotidyltransferase domain-containing protein n=1 Tax=Dictyoglomus thermophilum TaxID=14 RepID=A0A7C3RJM1_DICTH